MKNTSIGKDFKLALLSNSALNRLMLVYSGIAFIVLIAYLFISFQYDYSSSVWITFKSWLAMPLSVNDIPFKFYGLFIHMFIPTDFYSFLFCLMMIWSFGRIFTEFLGGRRLLPLFLYSGIWSAIITFVAFQIVTQKYWFGPDYLIGSFAPVMSIMTAVAVLYPNFPLNFFFFGPVKLKFIALLNFVFCFLFISGTGNMALFISAFAGIIFGAGFGFLFKKGYDITGGFIRITSFRNGNTFKQVRKPVMSVSYRRPLSDDQYNSIKMEKEATLDEILDKINEKGMKSLSKKEKQLLEKYSKG